MLMLSSDQRIEAISRHPSLFSNEICKAMAGAAFLLVYCNVHCSKRDMSCFC